MPGADDLSLSLSYFPQSITTPTGFDKNNPLQTEVSIPPSVLLAIDVLIPQGHAGQTGLQVLYSGQVILPFGGFYLDQWITGDADRVTFDFTFPLGGHPIVRTYNTGDFDHTHYVRFKVDYNAYTAQPSRPALAIVPTA